MTQARHPVHVVVAYDFSPSADEALARAVEVAARAPQHVLHIVDVLDPHERGAPGGPLKEASYQAADEVQRTIRDSVARSFEGRPAAGEVQFFVHARIGSAAEEILLLAAEVGADLIFIGSHGKSGVERIIFGSVSERVVREARCPVMVVRPKTYDHVDLMAVRRYDHEREPHREPHRYSYSNNQVIVRPRDWPLG